MIRHSTPGGRAQVLVFVVAYGAEKHLVPTFERVPRELFADPDVAFVCIDDASPDRGPDLLAEWVASQGIGNVTVLRNPVNQGYGGNQKLGYRLAIDGGYDFVILLHGDGQYAPELLPRFIETWRRERPDVILGSRIAEPGAARRGGMPLYKWMGNRVLTSIQNRLTGLGLTEYHTGYRGYATSFLSHVPFEANTNDFHFDTEILLQAAHVHARIVEFPIPTHYGDEVCHVIGIRYARNVLRATVRYRLHQVGMLCSLKYRDLAPSPYGDKTAMLWSSHRIAVGLLEKHGARRILDLGCGPGSVARECARLGMEVTGVDARPPAPETVTHFHRADLERDPIPVDPFDYDAVLLLDVIEHLAEPEQFLLGLRNRSRRLDVSHPAPVVIVSTPNVAFAGVRLNLLFGRFSYAERGILDITHKRLFTRSTLLDALRDCGYGVEEVHAVPVPFEAVLPGRIGRTLTRIASAFARLRPTLFAFQTLVVCRPRPSVAQILASAELHLAAERGPLTADSAAR